ncbi:hypothetical protein C6568_15130 [Melaminivora suipulveris]|uniref:Uncharacterized protein n=1 Tax=Melaminivora suipulveris TaxID=2109913 RepID=A0A2R3QF84_9BURK|nr:hypothetical protein [Melaminivora suipulveris]AVO50423.1 hypothetical protein C6568_15130 [Melaminivora suipulveris]
MSHRFWLASAAALLPALLAAQAAQAACYIVYTADQQVVYRAQTPPVDMSRQLHETLPLLVPGGSMVFSLDSNGCELEFNHLPVASRAIRASALPLGPRAPRAPRG